MLDIAKQKKKVFLTHPTKMKLSILDALVVGALLSYIGGLFLLMSFASPYWIESYDESFSSFKNMGLWEYCFKDFSYPYYQFPRLFNGCHNIFSHVSFYVKFKFEVKRKEIFMS